MGIQSLLDRTIKMMRFFFTLLALFAIFAIFAQEVQAYPWTICRSDFECTWEGETCIKIVDGYGQCGYANATVA